MSQERLNSTSEVRTAATCVVPSIGATLSRATNVTQKCRVVHGANEGYFDIQGKSVGQVRKSLREVFSIPSDAVALIAGQEVKDDHVIQQGEQLEFNKAAGVKG